MKTVSKSLLDEQLDLTRKYWDGYNHELFQARCENACKLSQQVFGNTYHWMQFVFLVESVLSVRGLNKEADNETFYRMFEAMGYEIKGESANGENQ